jgi:formylglycine-generating enzyme required for sulfatase activity
LWTNVYAYATNRGYDFYYEGQQGQNGTPRSNYPVETVDWLDCLKWCNARSQQAGLIPCYYTDAGYTHVFTNDFAGFPSLAVYQSLSCNGYRLPTEAEWEKAARGGLNGRRFPWGNLISAGQAQYAACTNCDFGYDLGPNHNPTGPSPASALDVNGYGLYDMVGNLTEWCWDVYATSYGQPTPINPTGPDGPSTVRVVRGGNWVNYAFLGRCAYRNYGDVLNANYIIGFRCVRGL